ncbi:hypothetical protein A7K94_0218265 [Modestobacter sp. VKM Ac-2676]|nr:hypothetical protein A7K94_0218265 [Modestobacter sp. VKM Ac-2676]
MLLLAITIGAIGWWLGSGRWTDVPDLVNQDRDTAVGLLQEAGLDPVFGDEVFSEELPAGTVISAEPAAGEAIRGSDVTLVLSKGQERFEVDPALVGQPFDAVQAALAEVPVGLTAREEFDDEQPTGTVLRFEPAAGTDLKRNDGVVAVVSAGRAPVKVPDVVGLSPEAATANLEERGFTVERTTGRSAAVDAGEVMAVSPGPGDAAQRYGSTVTIQVSEGVPQVTVPDVKGKSRDEAVALLTAAGLEAEQTQFIAGDRVFQQSPRAGEVVDQGSTVRILISFG